ncbi:chemotaxis protein CheW [Cellvibrio japonicus]|uniref:CheW domain protein n=1 Tax=Cellvibrio japonicus (strain Ueda107) TaxID=498211 RepID=B3PIJ3_CELJU|nr:chemotaxis protein CheW [Cellvibrio japonicus]ACE83892.1 CheW domain protein [Cellvibrio japonicus Ueda107]
MADIKAPQDSLASYFDELLGGDESEYMVQSLTLQPKLAAGVARVVALPQKSPAGKSSADKASSSSPKPNLVVAPPLVTPAPVYGEPETSAASPEQMQKLEKLFQSARTRLLIDSTTETAVAEQPVQPQTVTAFQERPDEIQAWDVGIPENQAGDQLASAVAVEEQRAAYQLEGVEWLDNGRPLWAQSRFDVLLFSVSGLTLAVPLISLGQIQPLTDELTPLFGQADWFMGLQPTSAGKIRTVNTARFVMPERYDENFLATAKYVVSINGVPWGLAVDSVNQPISLHPDDVKWRGDRSKRPWLAGTVKEHMCALLDIPRIGQMLIDADKNFRPAATH